MFAAYLGLLAGLWMLVRRGQHPRKRILMVGLIVLFVGSSALGVCLRKVRLDRVGVVIDNFGAGVQEMDREAGFCWIWPGFQTLALWDPTLQVIHLEERTLDAGEGYGSGELWKTRAPQAVDMRVHIRGKDQYTTHLDMTVLYWILREGAEKKTKAWSVARNLGSMDRVHEIATRNSTKAIWEVMSKLATEDFYNTKLRVERSHEAWDTLNKAIASEGLEVLDVLVRKIDYDTSFESRLLEKQLLEQDQLLQTSLAKAEKEKQITEKIEKETEAFTKKITEEREKDVKSILAEKEKKLREIEGDTQLYTVEVLSGAKRALVEKTAEGNLLLERGRAKGEEAINQAYLRTGGDTLLGKKVMESIEFGTIEINTNLWNPFDVDETLRRILGGAAVPPVAR